MDSSDTSLNLDLQSRTFYLYQFPPSHTLFKGILNLLTANDEDENNDRFISVTRTSEEISVVLDGELSEFGDLSQERIKMSKWSCIRVQGPMSLDLVGILNRLTLPLKIEAIPVFALSTWNTDYILIPLEHAIRAVHALRQDGWIVNGA